MEYPEVRHHEVLLVEDEPTIRFGIRRFLEGRGFKVAEAPDCRAARSAWRRQPPDIAVLDYQLPDGDAFELLPSLRSSCPKVPVIILTGHSTVDLAVQAMKRGAADFLTKPVQMESLVGAVKNSLSAVADSHPNGFRSPATLAARRLADEPDPFVGESAAIGDLAVDARRVAGSDCPVLLLGETGSGKGVLARWIHRQSHRRSEAMMELNCAGLSRDLLESELFGHSKGAFTGASSTKQGLLEAADGGTVFLDEVGDLDQGVQPKLLKVVEEHTFRRLGEVRSRNSDLRLIAATHHRLAEQVAEGSFRADLYYRLCTFCLTLPPLRQRPEDIEALSDALLNELTAGAANPPRVDELALETLRRHDWPGNIRELKNVLQRALVFSEGGTIRDGHLRFDTPVQFSPHSPLSSGSLEQAERRLIEAALLRHGGNVTAAARQLGLGRSTLYEKVKRYDLR